MSKHAIEKWHCVKCAVSRFFPFFLPIGLNRVSMIDLITSAIQQRPSGKWINSHPQNARVANLMDIISVARRGGIPVVCTHRISKTHISRGIVVLAMSSIGTSLKKVLSSPSLSPEVTRFVTGKRFSNPIDHCRSQEASFSTSLNDSFVMMGNGVRPAFVTPLPVSNESSANPIRKPRCPIRDPMTSRPSLRQPSCTLLQPPTKSAPTPPSITSEAVPGHPEWRHLGPPLNSGAKPTIVYLALTAEQSLELDPFNQFVTNIHPNQNVRILSVTLPFHTSDMLDNERAFDRWADTYRAGGDLVSGFVRKVSAAIDDMIFSDIIKRDSVYVAGLSRGGLLATHLAIVNSSVRACVGFAPVTVLSELSEFSDESIGVGKPMEKVRKASLFNDSVVDKLVDIPVRFYMGNFDQRVGTRNAFELIHQIVERAASQGVRSPPHEFIMYCSVGKHGHGTPPDVFQAGADYILSRIEEDATERRRVASQ